MRAEQFIKDHGLEKVRTLIGQFEKDQFAFKAFDPAADCCFDTGLYSGKEKEWWDVCIYDLQRLVESVDLVKSYGGLMQAKMDIRYLDIDWDYDSPRRVRLDTAISDYESIYGEGNEN